MLKENAPVPEFGVATLYYRSTINAIPQYGDTKIYTRLHAFLRQKRSPDGAAFTKGI